MATRIPAGGKRDFAKRAVSFADRVPAWVPTMWVVAAAACALAILTGPFHTIDLPIGQRAALWMLLIGWNVAKWQAWFWWMVRRPADWLRAGAIGAVVVNLPLPIEIAAALWIVGVGRAPQPVSAWLAALAISAIIGVVIAIVRRGSESILDAPAADGPLARSRTMPADLVAITAEDHYCRFHRRDGASVLVHARFADALADVAGLSGMQTHRGAWVATDGVSGAVREGRRWTLTVVGGHKLPVSASYLAAVRARGWLRR